MTRSAVSTTLLAVALGLTLGACAPKPAAGPADPAATPPAAQPAPTAEAPVAETAPDTAPMPSGPCNADAVQSLIGQEGTEAVIEQARIDSGSNTVRALKPGQPATMDFRPDRLDIALDEAGIIQTLRCG